MPKKPKVIVLDSWAVMAYLEDEPSGERIADILADAHEEGTPLLMSVINVGEVWYIVAREASQSDAEHCLKEIKELGIEIIDANWGITQIAASFKSRYKMSYADCFAAALAKDRKAHVVTGDPEFKEVEQEVQVLWV
jgi:predicted nucleic acid-binding protein